MASGIKSNGTDWDSIFLARVNAARADVGLQSNGQDVAQRYESIAYGVGPSFLVYPLLNDINANTLFCSIAGDFAITITQYPSHLPANSPPSSPTVLSFSVTSNVNGTSPFTYSWSVTNISGTGSYYIVGSSTGSSLTVDMLSVSSEPTIGRTDLVITDALSRTASATSHVYMNAQP
ncbi:MAG: hypothetical protein ACRESI_06430 [Gammaproteobacteria bacterium]